jgi:hypothetical protein
MAQSLRDMRDHMQIVFKKEKLHGDGLALLSLRAQLAQYIGVGNCHEQAAVAFEYLRTTGRETGLACVAFPKHNHVFVVLGLPAKPPDNDTYQYGAGPPANWGDSAVVCDPWYHEWFEASIDWKRKGELILTKTAPGVASGDKIKITLEAYV